MRKFCIFLVLLFVKDVFNQTLLEVIEQKEKAVTEMAKKIELVFEGRCSIVGECGCQYDACQSTLDPDTTECSGDATLSHCSCPGMKMDMSNSVVRLPDGVATELNGNPPSTEEGKALKETICYSGLLDENFIESEAANPDFEWQGFGSWNGMFRIYPGRAQESCYTYDPRVRSWYVGASSGPKDVVLIMDRSGSMDDPVGSTTRMELAKDAAINVLKTLTHADYANVVFFDSYASILHGDRLLRGTKENIKILTDKINAKTPNGGTNFQQGFEKANTLLTTSRANDATASCHTAILFLTDGQDSSAGQTLINYVKTMRENFDNATIFTYSLGANAETTWLENVACQTDGIWQGIINEENIRGQMSLYYDYFATGMGIDKSNRSVWVEPYTFATDNKLGTSVSSPVYSYATNPPMFLGVVGTGLSISELEEIEPDYETMLLQLQARSEYCPDFHLSYCQIEALRDRYDQSKTCGGVTCPSIELNPSSCTSKTYPTDLWCNVEGTTQSYKSKSCCYCAIDDIMTGVYIGIASVSVIIIVLIIIILGCGYACVKYKKEINKWFVGNPKPEKEEEEIKKPVEMVTHPPPNINNQPQFNPNVNQNFNVNAPDYNVDYQI